MTIRLKFASALRSAVVFSSIFVAAPAVAQSSERSGAPVQPTVLGPATAGSASADLSCGAGAAGLASWSADIIEDALSLNDAQRARFSDLKAASQRAIQYLSDSCPKNDPASPTGRLEARARRLSAMLEAVRIVQPALDDFYATLSDEQKARLAAIEPSADAREATTDRRGRTRHRRRFRFRLPF
ncbi:MAG TPA: Spy/CpxP family protein refolding chaperone [Xanthobacteraceae bacterium]|nr:Spy/CpxP family protein refolding chaperone [Xanthobacteraceae bacterium]